MQAKDVTTGQRFVIDRGFGPEEFTATADARALQGWEADVWQVACTNYDGRDTWIKVLGDTPVTLLP